LLTFDLGKRIIAVTAIISAREKGAFTKMRLVPIFEVQKIASEKYMVNPRTFQWYVTKGLIPKAIRKGREAFYDIDDKKINVFDYLSAIKTLYHIYTLKIESIGYYIKLYESQLKKLNLILKEIAKKYPALYPADAENLRLQNVFLLKTCGKEPKNLENISLDVLKAELRSGFWDKRLSFASQGFELSEEFGE